MFPNTLTLTTWNVLHRVHGVNWQEPCIAAFPEESTATLESPRAS